jgi:hypothetical protein
MMNATLDAVLLNEPIISQKSKIKKKSMDLSPNTVSTTLEMTSDAALLNESLANCKEKGKKKKWSFFGSNKHKG